MPTKPRERTAPPNRLDFTLPRRARYGIDLEDGSTYVGDAWASLDGCWLHVIDDDHGVWQTWPSQAVNFVEWVDA